MEIATFQPDRILLTLFVSVLVAFVTAALSIVRLVNDKEGKTTDYRQAWTESVRKSLSELVSNINALSGASVNYADYIDRINEMLKEQRDNQIEKLSDGDATLRAHLAEQIAAETEYIRTLRRDLHQSYALTRLHFKPNDLSFARIEQKYDVILGMLDDFKKIDGDTASAGRLLLKEKIHTAAAEISAFARDILKTEWENVKRGEPAYQRTKAWSLVGGAVALMILLIFGASAALSYFRGNMRQGSDTTKSCTNINTTSSGTFGGVQQQMQPSGTIQPQTSQVVNVYPVTPLLSAQRPPQSSPPVTVHQQPCAK